MEQIVLREAAKLGFPSQLNEANCWQILPMLPEETWKLIAAESRWILSVKNVPQLNLNVEQAISFLVFQAKSYSQL